MMMQRVYVYSSTVRLFSPQCKAYYFDVDAKLWKPLPSVVQSDEETSLCFCAERIGNYFFVAEQKQGMLNS